MLLFYYSRIFFYKKCYFSTGPQIRPCVASQSGPGQGRCEALVSYPLLSSRSSGLRAGFVLGFRGVFNLHVSGFFF